MTLSERKIHKYFPKSSRLTVYLYIWIYFCFPKLENSMNEKIRVTIWDISLYVRTEYCL